MRPSTARHCHGAARTVTTASSVHHKQLERSLHSDESLTTGHPSQQPRNIVSNHNASDAMLTDYSHTVGSYCIHDHQYVCKEPFSSHISSSFFSGRSIIAKSPCAARRDFAPLPRSRGRLTWLCKRTAQRSDGSTPWSHDIPIVPLEITDPLTGGRTSALAAMKGLKFG